MPKYLESHGKTLTLAGQKLSAELYDPAVGAMLGWLAAGDVARHSRYGELSQVVLNTAQGDRFLREDIAIETFVRALVPFLRRLDRGDFDTNGAASVTTFFIGACRNRIGEVVWSHHTRIMELRADTEELLDRARNTTIGPDTVDGFELARDLLLKAPRNLRSVLLLVIYEGTTLAEAAKRVGVKPTTIRSQLMRYKNHIAWLHFRRTLEIPEATSLGQWARNTAEERKIAAEARRAKQSVA
ncbi:RNA polymerase sigma factor [Nocardia tengchongensis]|uniref:RNA polymerase sigma factor n=1 Tax=Nocardia tengchongensis TaxID=2055889 RepID=UPI0036C1D0B1